MSYRPLLVALGAVAIAACGPDRGFDDVAPYDATHPMDASHDDVLDGASDHDGAVDDRALPDVQRLDATPQVDMTIVYAHSDTVLYAIDPNHHDAFTTVGTFAFPSGDSHQHAMTDLAVDATGALVGVTGDALWHIDATTARCTLVVALPGSHQFVGLTWLPVGVLDPSSEVLLGGAIDGTYWRIDPATGSAHMLGQLHDSHGTWQLSGDFVSVAGAGTFATLHSTMSGTTTDSLATVDLATGTVTVLGTTGYTSIFGLGYWRATLFGFTRSGQFIQIDPHTATGTLVGSPAHQFSGAGVTTVAPIAPG